MDLPYTSKTMGVNNAGPRKIFDHVLFSFSFRIEHLEPDILDSVPKVVFGQLSPKVVIVTTPNVEFNVLFPDLKGFRHYDHKFEWTRAEFQEWLVIAIN